MEATAIKIIAYMHACAFGMCAPVVVVASRAGDNDAAHAFGAMCIGSVLCLILLRSIRRP